MATEKLLEKKAHAQKKEEGRGDFGRETVVLRNKTKNMDFEREVNGIEKLVHVEKVA